MALQFVKNTKCNNELQINNYLYQKHRINNDEIEWRCKERRRSKCNATCFTNNNITLQYSQSQFNK